MEPDLSVPEHSVFTQLLRYEEFYKTLAYEVFYWMSQGTQGVVALDTYALSSMEGTLESMRLVLRAGHINDAFALLRKFDDSATINIYSTLFLRSNYSLENRIVTQINDWVRGAKKLPRYRAMMEYIKSAREARGIIELFDRTKGGTFDSIRRRCNDHAHYNFFRYVVLNDSRVYVQDRLTWLDQLSEDLRNIVIFHVGCLFYVSSHFMMASDYRDAMDVGMAPEAGCEYRVAPFVQKFFDEDITPTRPDITAAIKSSSKMELD